MVIDCTAESATVAVVSNELHVEGSRAGGVRREMKAQRAVLIDSGKTVKGERAGAVFQGEPDRVAVELG